MILYLDTSAFVKLFINEPGSKQVQGAVQRAADCYTHLITYVEIRAALAKALRVGRETEEGLELHRSELEIMWRSVNVISPNETLIHRAAELAEQFGLRAYDSVHLAAADVIRTVAGEAEFTFAVFDTALRDAAKALGIGLLKT